MKKWIAGAVAIIIVACVGAYESLQRPQAKDNQVVVCGAYVQALNGQGAASDHMLMESAIAFDGDAAGTLRGNVQSLPAAADKAAGYLSADTVAIDRQKGRELARLHMDSNDAGGAGRFLRACAEQAKTL